MNGPVESPDFALLVRSSPYCLRSARVDLDVALAAAAMDFRVGVYFLGAAVLQVVEERTTAAAQLPAGLRGWGALPDMGEFALYAEQSWMDRLPAPLILPVEGRDREWMRTHWRQSRHVMVM